MTKRANREQWNKRSNIVGNKIATKTEEKLIDKIVDKEVNRIVRICTLADRLSDKMEQAISELDLTTVTHKKRKRTIEYNDSEARGKPTKEIIEDEEKLIKVASIIDKAGLKQLASALKDIKDIQTSTTSGQENSDDDGFIDALNKKAAEIDWGDDNAEEEDV